MVGVGGGGGGKEASSECLGILQHTHKPIFYVILLRVASFFSNSVINSSIII